jgi:D-alanyl-D-alanine carboxypeptidase/D-alanyl-D-alanine-endopeptidase (penicillin-binding protein 4)
MRTRRGWPVGGGVLFLILLATAPALARDPSPQALKKRIDAIVERPAFAPAFWGIEVRDLRSGRVLYAKNAEKNFKPASTLKLVTTAAVLDALGPDERLRTTVETAGRLDAFGRVLGDVYLVGRGDPNLSGRFTDGRRTAAFQEMADALWAAGVRRIEGRLVGHEGLFSGDRRGEDWSWGDLVWWYGAEVSALSFNDNCADLRVTAGERPGDPVRLEREPPSAYYRVVSTATTAPAGAAADLTLTRAPGSNDIHLSGTFPLAAEAWEGFAALEDPARYAATVFAEVLAARGIAVAGAVETSSAPLPAGVRVLAAHESPPLLEILKAVNKTSQNLHAEMMLRLLGARRRGSGSPEAGREAVAEFLRRVGVQTSAWALQDGSGLSRSDILTPHELASLLAAMDRHPRGAAFKETLPIAGRDGTLKNRMKGGPAEGRVVAKTGTLRHVNALAGYVTTRGGSRLAFVALANHHTSGGASATHAIDEIGALLASF